MGKREKKPKVSTDGPRERVANNPFAAALGHLSAPDDALAAPVDPQPQSPAPLGEIRTRLERKGHGGKMVTVVTGVPASRSEPIAAQLKAALGTGVRVVDDQLVVQGDLGPRILAWFDEHGDDPC